MSAWDCFSHVFCINLDARPDRWAEATRELLVCGIGGYERFRAIDRRGTGGGAGASHRALWRRIASGECGERVLILEDDFMVLSRERLLSAVQVRIYDSLPGTTGEERMTALRSYLPGAWDLLYLGGSYQTQPLSRLNAHVVRNYGMTRAHAYGISWQAAERITRELDGKHGVGSEDDPRVTVGVPGQILVPYAKNPDVFSYTVTPRLFIQRPTSQSDRVSTPPRLESDQIDAQRETAV